MLRQLSESNSEESERDKSPIQAPRSKALILGEKLSIRSRILSERDFDVSENYSLVSDFSLDNVKLSLNNKAMGPTVLSFWEMGRCLKMQSLPSRRDPKAASQLATLQSQVQCETCRGSLTVVREEPLFPDRGLLL